MEEESLQMAVESSAKEKGEQNELWREKENLKNPLPHRPPSAPFLSPLAPPSFLSA